MTHYRTDDVRIEQGDELLAPMQVMRELAATERPEETTFGSRKAVHDILRGADDRLLVVVGPCSIHDYAAAIDYAKRLKGERERLKADLEIVMRVYFEKPRTTVGWKGFINDPHLDETFDMNEGIRLARKLLREINEIGVPCGTEFLDLISPQYIADLISWGAIGARTTESQTHREMASGLSMPVGIKNGTDGGLSVAINALLAISTPHSFLGIDEQGRCAIVKTRGNRYGHVVMRGGAKPNYDAASIGAAEQALAARKLAAHIMVDCSHGNSNKDPATQPTVLADCVEQIRAGNRSLIGMMLESNLESGNQPIPQDRSQLRYGVSVTDGCIDWDTTASALRQTRDKLRDVLPKRAAVKAAAA